MKRFVCLLFICLLLCPAALALEIRTAPYETAIVNPSTETEPPILTITAGIREGERYAVLEVIDQSNAAQQPPWVQAWLDTYILHRVWHYDPIEKEIDRGYVVAGYVPQDRNAQPKIQSEFGHVITVEGSDGQPLTFEGIDKWYQGFTLRKPAEGALCMEDALRIALDALMDKYAETEATLKRLYISYGHRPASEHYPDYWQFDFGCHLYALDGYAVYVASETGEILGVYGPGDGNG